MFLGDFILNSMYSIIVEGDLQMTQIPILGFSGYSNSGKTTLIEKLIKILKKKGLRVAVIKHHAHNELQVDETGRDSWRFTQAGADISIVSSPEKTAYIEQRSLEFTQLVSLVHDVDLILVEGFKREPITQIGICRKETKEGFPSDLNRYIAIVTDMEEMEADLPKFALDDVDSLADFIMSMIENELFKKNIRKGVCRYEINED